MKKASNIILLVSGILSIVSLFWLLIAGVIMFALSGQKKYIEEGLIDGSIDTSFAGTTAEQVEAISIMFIILGVVFVVLALLYIASSIISFKARKADTKGMYIASIVIGALCENFPLIVGAILGLVALNQETKKVNVVEE